MNILLLLFYLFMFIILFLLYWYYYSVIYVTVMPVSAYMALAFVFGFIQINWWWWWWWSHPNSFIVTTVKTRHSFICLSKPQHSSFHPILLSIDIIRPPSKLISRIFGLFTNCPCLQYFRFTFRQFLSLLILCDFCFLNLSLSWFLFEFCLHSTCSISSILSVRLNSFSLFSSRVRLHWQLP